MITSNSDTFGIFGVQPQLVFLGDASPKSGNKFLTFALK